MNELSIGTQVEIAQKLLKILENEQELLLSLNKGVSIDHTDAIKSVKEIWKLLQIEKG